MAHLPKGKGVIPLPPFQAWLASNIPAVYDNTMTYYEELCALIKYLQDTVVPATNENAEAITILSEYVEHYFDNLDIQEEVNKKLDEMVESGELQRIINIPASKTNIGGVIVGDGLDVDAEGKISVPEYDNYIPGEFKTVRYNGAGGYSTVYYALIEKDYHPKLTLANGTVNTVQTGGDNALDNKTTLTVNAGRFNTSNGTTRGVIIVDGEILKQNDSGGTGENEILYMTSDGILNSVTDITSADQLISLGAIWAVEGWYPFIKNSVDLTGSRDPSDYQPRSIVAQDSEGNYLVFSVMGRSYNESGFNAIDCVNFANSIGFTPVFMYNLDGGASVCFVQHGRRMNGLIDYSNRPDANFLSWISDSAKYNGVFESANTANHVEIQNLRTERPINNSSRITWNANVSASANNRIRSFGSLIIGNIDFTVNTAVNAYGRIIEGLPGNSVSDSHFVFRKANANETADLYVETNGRLVVASGNSLSTGRWFGNIIYSTDNGLTQDYSPE